MPFVAAGDASVVSEDGAQGRIRAGGHLITGAAFYQLSYPG